MRGRKNKMDEIKENPWSVLLNFAKEAKDKLWVSVIFASLGVLFGMLPYFAVAKLLTFFYYETATLKTVLLWCGLAVLGVVLKMILTTISTMKSHEAAFTILKNIRFALTDKMQRIPLGVMIETPVGTLKTMVIDAVEKIEKPLAHIFPEMTSNLLTPLVITGVIFALDWRMALAALVTIPIGFLITMGQMIGYKEKSSAYYNANAAMNDAIVEYVNGIEVIKAFNQSASSYGKFTYACENFRDITLQWWRSCWFFSAIGNTIMNSIIVVTLPVGAFLFMKGQLEFSNFMLCVILSIGISGPILAAMSFIDSIANIMEAIKQVNVFLKQPELSRPKERVELTEEGFVLKEVDFGYGGKSVLNQVSLKTVTKGMTAIVGPSGGGKSTIAKLMAGFWDPDLGEVYFGGKNLKSISFEQLMENVSYVAQDNYLFDVSILENIRMGRPSASDEEVIEAAKMAGCHDFIAKLPQGYYENAGDAGGNLSGGERQRITIARALLKDAQVIILDEATAFSDPENEAAIQASIANLIKGKTLIVIAHRLATVCKADQILVVEKGAIVAQGTHTTLLKKSPLYQSMWQKYIATTEDMEVA
jgi:ATP-binding cassette subfamily B protein